MHRHRAGGTHPEWARLEVQKKHNLACSNENSLWATDLSVLETSVMFMRAEFAKLTKKSNRHHPAASNFRKQKETSALLIAKKERESYTENSV